MRLLIGVLATFLSIAAAVAQETRLPPDVLADVRKIIAGLSDEDRNYICDLPQDQLIMLHHGFGTGLRNSFRENKYPALFKYCGEHLEHVPSFDAYSWVPIGLIWRELRSVPPQSSP